jgi:hypothetical protein
LSDSHPNFNKYQSMLRFLKALRVPNIDEVYPAPMQQDPKTGQMVPAKDVPAAPNPKMLDVQLKEKKFELEKIETQIALQNDVKETNAHVIEMEAHAKSLLAQAKGSEMEPIIKLIYAQIESAGKHKDHVAKMLDLMNDMAGTVNERANQDQANAGMAGMAGPAGNAAVSQNARPNGGGGAGGLAH